MSPFFSKFNCIYGFFRDIPLSPCTILINYSNKKLKLSVFKMKRSFRCNKKSMLDCDQK